MTTISEFVPFVAVKVARDMPTANIQHALRETLVFFLEQTRAAVGEMYLDVPADEYEVLLGAPECRRLVGVEGVFIVPQSQCGPQRGQVRWRPDWEAMRHASYEGEPGWQMDVADGNLATMWVSPASRHPRRLCVRYAWTPKRDATCEVPDWVFERFADAIADGAMSYLHANPADKEANPQFAALTSRALRAAIDEVKRQHAAAHGPRRISVAASHFFQG